MVSFGRQDALFQVGRVGAVQQQMLVMVGLYHQVVGSAYGHLHLFVGLAAVGDDDKPLPRKVDGVAQAVGRVVADAETVYLHARQFPCLSFLEVSPCGAQFLSNAVVAVNTFVDELGGVDGQMYPFAECADGANVVGVVVRDEYAHYVAEVESHFSESFVYGACRHAGVNQYALLPCA